jgi:hypothetical protein
MHDKVSWAVGGFAMVNCSLERDVIANPGEKQSFFWLFFP